MYVVTLFSGRGWALDDYWEWLSREPDARLVGVDNSHDYAFARRIFDRLREGDHLFLHGAALAPGTSQHSTEFASHMARLYRSAQAYVPPGEYVLTVEDDVLPPPGACAALRRAMEEEGADVLTALYPSRVEPQSFFAWAHLPPCSVRVTENYLEHHPEAVFPVAASGLGCCLFSPRAWQSLSFQAGPPREPYFDIELGRQASRAGLRWMLDRRVLCRHRQQAGEWHPCVE